MEGENGKIIYEHGKGRKKVSDERALQFLEQEAEKGDISAMFQLGLLYHNGDGESGIAVDSDRSAYFLEQAASMGHVDAMFFVSDIYLNGFDTLSPNPSMGIKYMKQAADCGHIPASMNMGTFYQQGIPNILSVDINEAVKYFTKVVDNPHASLPNENGDISYASMCLGDIFMERFSFNNNAPDLDKAIRYLESAIAQDNSQALVRLAGIYVNGYGHIKGNLKKAISLYKRAVALNEPEAMIALATLYENGHSNGKFSRNMIEAISYYEQAAQCGNVTAMYNLGNIFTKGIGTPNIDKDFIAADISKAIGFYKQAIENGDAYSMYDLGIIYYHGDDGIPADINKAISLFQEAAALGHVEAMHNLGAIYYHGSGGTMVDISLAISYFECAAKEGDGKSCFNLGVIYENGEDSIVQDLTKAVEFYEQAAAKGIVAAMFNLGVIFSNGRGNEIQPDINRAIKYYKQGAGLLDDGERDAENCEDEGDWEDIHSEDSRETENNFWLQQWCLYSLGICYRWIDNIDETSRCFQSNVDSGFNLGYVGLAAVQKDDSKIIDCLIQAAEHGIAEAWNTLTEWVEHPHLLGTWNVESIASLKVLNDRKRGSSNDLMRVLETKYSPSLQHCYLCRNEQALQLSRGVNRTISTPPTTHIDCSLFSSCPFASSSKGAQGEVVLRNIQVSASTTRLIALKRCIKGENDLVVQSELQHLQAMRGSDFIVQCFGHTQIDGTVYVAMEGARYGDLYQLLLTNCVRDYCNHSLSLAVRWMMEIASGLAYMHSMFVQHCDVKPHNVLVFDGLHVKLSDLGLSRKAFKRNARVLDPHKKYDGGFESRGASTSGTSSFVGTLYYMAPELKFGDEISFKSDVYSFGVTCIQIITGDSIGVEVNKQVSKALDKLRAASHGDNNLEKPVQQLINLLTGCLEVSKDNRLSISECVNRLEGISSELECKEVDINTLLQKL